MVLHIHVSHLAVTPYSKRAGVEGGSYTTVSHSNIYMKSEKLHSAAGCFVLTPHPAQVTTTCYFWADTLNQGFAGEKA